MNRKFKNSKPDPQPDHPKLVDRISIRDVDDRRWYRDFLGSIFRSPDMDYSQFLELERMKSRQEILRKNWF